MFLNMYMYVYLYVHAYVCAHLDIIYTYIYIHTLYMSVCVNMYISPKIYIPFEELELVEAKMEI